MLTDVSCVLTIKSPSKIGMLSCVSAPLTNCCKLLEGNGTYADNSVRSPDFDSGECSDLTLQAEELPQFDQRLVVPAHQYKYARVVHSLLPDESFTYNFW